MVVRARNCATGARVTVEHLPHDHPVSPRSFVVTCLDGVFCNAYSYLKTGSYPMHKWARF
jgi:hypothetical protein